MRWGRSTPNSAASSVDSTRRFASAVGEFRLIANDLADLVERHRVYRILEKCKLCHVIRRGQIAHTMPGEGGCNLA